ncbi:ABC transporter ATP-binding protein [Halalkalibacter alkaliphilus]|uniref:ABC transporter ATP-binding protein n=1 Tax=Halalkalibacter alkaliphilus TaxID=2917993 RepID=A0A9X2I6N4_9BACI|nr:ABC transporter ATP-binding protein [Halalkalibacter alkaliphilus]MCL7749316.1 ABC transporter ATP-binding protein [Halalkalibacter alkaliphilus]
MAYLDLQNIGKVYPTKQGDFEVLRNVDLLIDRGEFVSLIGHSGCGKSTVLNIVSGLEKATTGKVFLDGKRITGPGPERGVVFQNYSLLPWLTVWGNVYEVVDAVFPKRTKAEKDEIVEHFLTVVGLWKHRHKRPDEISGGMKQRAAIARAFAVKPQVLLLDEPFGALDALTRSTLQDELVNLMKSTGTTDEREFEHIGTDTVIMVTHDIDEAIFLSDRIVVMTNGPSATIDTIIKVPVKRPRDRRELINQPVYNELKQELLEYLHGTPAAH